MKLIFTLLLSTLSVCLLGQTALAPCPNSPNCVSTQETRKMKRMAPIVYTGSLAEAKALLASFLSNDMKGATRVVEDNNYWKYEFTTSIGKFVDDVEFIFDETNQTIHFRSASRIGYGDFGANRRRMKKIRRAFR